MFWAGQVWRAFTALFVQDSGPAGAAFNLATLLLLGSVAESRLGSVRWLVIYFCAGVVTEFLALAWQPYGAGNSVACYALASALMLNAFRPSISVVQGSICVVGLGAGVTLLLLRDIHGLGFFVGVLCAFVLQRLHDLRSPSHRKASPARASVRQQ